jgi:serine/threonine protein kinase
MQKRIKDRYEIRETLGQGGMGLIYRAYDTLIKRDVALKTLRDISDASVRQLFHREYEVLASMSHPNIVEIFDIGDLEEEGTLRPFFVMPLLPGVTLEQLIRTSSHRLTVERTVDIMAQTCRGLQAAHERGLVHRDLKPSNIFVMEDDSVKIIDFGVAHVPDSHSRTGLKGTLLYMSPEQVEMKSPSPLSDLFSLGVVAYETLTQRRPFERPSERDVVDAILHYIPPPASELNPAVNQAVSRVIHKAMAKQPYHRFTNARELAETLQKALRNEPIEIFDPSRIQPRIQRANKAFEAADYQFAEEILSELEAEGHIDPGMSMLRLKIDQAVRQRRILQLLDSARTRMEEQEYPLALQKVQEVLELDPSNATALRLKGTIEEQRTEGKIDDWFRLARQHIENHAYTHARQALQNVLQLKPKDTQATKLLAEVDRQEQDYKKVRQEKEQYYQAAVEAWRNGEISVALTRLERVMELDRRAPDSFAPDRSASYQTLYNQVRSEHDAINRSYQEAKKHLADRNFVQAIQVCEQYLAKYPGHALFQALKFDVEEQQRQELSKRIAEIDRQVEAEPDLDKRVNILKEASKLYPGEPHFERSLRTMREKRDLVNSIIAKARAQEESGQLNDAIGQWEILRTIYSQYPGLNFEIDRLLKRRDQQARADAKTRWVEQVDRQLESRNYSRALELLQEAQKEFPGDAELEELEKLARQGLERADEALKLMGQGQDLCNQGKFDEGLDLLRKAHQQDEFNPTIERVLLNTLVERARVLLDNDWRSAETLVQQALDLDPGHALAKSLRTLAQDRKREEFVEKCVAQARRLQGSGDLQGALTQVQQGLSTFENEPRLTQLHSTLNKELTETQRRQSRRRDLDELRRLEREAEAVGDLAAAASIGERAESLARHYPDDSEFQSVANDIQRRVVHVKEAFEPLRRAGGAGLPLQPPQGTYSGETAVFTFDQAKAQEAPGFHPSAMGAPRPPLGGQPSPLPRPPEALPKGPQEVRGASPGAPNEPLPTIPLVPSKVAPGVPSGGKWDQGPSPSSATAVFEVGRIPPPASPQPSVTGPKGATPRVPPERQTVGSASAKPTRATGGLPQAPIPVEAHEPGKVAQRKPLILIGVAVAIFLIAIAALFVWFWGKRTVSAMKYAVEVRTSPPGARIRINNEERGNSPISLQLPEGNYQVEAWKDGYVKASQPLSVKPGSNVPVDLDLQPLPQIVHILGDLETGKVSLDGQAAGELQEGQLALDSVSFQPHKLDITGPHGRATVNFEALPGAMPVVTSQPQAAEVKVVAVSNLGVQVNVQSSIPGLKAGLDDQAPQDVGPQGLTLNGSAPGTHDLILQEGKNERKVSIELGQSPVLNVFIYSDRSVGSLLVKTTENDVQVFIDKKPYRRLTKDGEVRISNLEPGPHTIRVAKDGYQSELEQRVSIVKGQEARVFFTLRPVPKAASLRIQGALPGTEVLADGTSLGKVDANGVFTYSNISPGERMIELRLEQHQSKQLQKNFPAGQSISIVPPDSVLALKVGMLLINVRNLSAGKLTSLVGTRSGETRFLELKPGANHVEVGAYKITARWANNRECAKPADVPPGDANPARVELTPDCK